MRSFRTRALPVIIGLMSLTLPVALACTGGVPQAEYDSVKQQLAEREKEVAAVKQQLEQAAGQKTAPPIIGAVPNAPPRPAPTPTPQGFVAPPPPQPPAAESKTLFLDVNTITAGPGESKYNVDADKYCALSTVFKRGMHLVWLMEAFDASTGKELQTADVREAVVKLPNGDTAGFRYGRHGTTDNAPWFWSAAWDIPPDYPLGILDYVVEVTTATGKKETYKAWGAHMPERNITNYVTIID